jgi:hypothetical protein
MPRFSLLVIGLALLGADAPPTEEADPWRGLERCQKEFAGVSLDDPARFEARFACQELAHRVAQEAEPSDHDRLWRAHDALAWDHPVARGVLGGLLEEKLARAAGTLAARPSTFAAASDPLPPDLGERARALHEAVSGAYDRVLEEAHAGETIAVQENWSAFHTAVADLVRERSAPREAAAHIARFVWGGWCGTGSFALHEPQSRALALAFLMEGRYEPAAGALLVRRSSPGVATEEERLNQVLAAAGLDAELLRVGEALDWDTSGLAAVGRHGSERAARLLLEAGHQPTGPDRDGAPLRADGQWLSALAAFVTRGEGCGEYGSGWSTDVERRSSAAVSGEVQARILAALAEAAGPSAGLDEAEVASHLLVSLCRPESRPAFREMTRSPFAEVRKRGALALASLGEPVPVLPADRPVVFRLGTDDQPLASQTVAWEVHAAPVKGGARTVSSQGPTDGEGRLELARDPFVDPRAPVTRVALTAPRLESPEAAWFRVVHPVTAPMEAVIDVPLATQALTLVPSERGADREQTPSVGVRLSARYDAWGGGEVMVPVSGDLEVPGSKPVVFPRLQAGVVYQVEVTSEGRTWTSGELRLGDEPLTVEYPARLDP